MRKKKRSSCLADDEVHELYSLSFVFETEGAASASARSELPSIPYSCTYTVRARLLGRATIPKHNSQLPNKPYLSHPPTPPPPHGIPPTPPPPGPRPPGAPGRPCSQRSRTTGTNPRKPEKGRTMENDPSQCFFTGAENRIRAGTGARFARRKEQHQNLYRNENVTMTLLLTSGSNHTISL